MRTHCFFFFFNIFHRQSLLSLACGFNLNLVELVENTLIPFLGYFTSGAQLWLYSHYHCMLIIHRNLLLRVPWMTRVCSSENQAWKCYDYLAHGKLRWPQVHRKTSAIDPGDMALLGSFLGFGSSAPVRTRSMGGAAAQITRTLVVPSEQEAGSHGYRWYDSIRIVSYPLVAGA